MLSLVSIIVMIGIVIAIGILAVAVQKTPFLDSGMKAFLKWLLIAIGVIVFLVFAFGAIGWGDGIYLYRPYPY